MTAISPFLALNIRSGSPQVRRYVNATPTAIGVAVTGAAADNNTGGITNNTTTGYPAVVKFGGSQTFLAVVGNQVFRSTDGGATWSSVLTLSNLTSNLQGAKAGIWILSPGGVATATVIWSDGATTASAARSTNGTSWTTATGTFAHTDTQICVDSVLWQGRVVSLWSFTNGGGDTPSSLTYDPTSISFSSATSTNTGFNLCSALCVFQNRLFMLVQDTSGICTLREQVAGVWSDQQIVASSISGSALTAQAKIALFTDGTNMYALYYKGVSVTGWKCAQFDSSLTKTDITASVIPAGLDTSASTTSRFRPIIDGRASPGSTPTIWLYYATDGNAATNWTEYAWNGNASLMTLVETAGDVADAMPFIRNSQGSYFWTATEDYLELKGIVATTGGMNVSVALYSDSGSGTSNIRGWRGTGIQSFPLTAATLTGTTTGLPLDGTTQTVKWEAQTDGFTAGDLAKFVMEQF